MLVKMLKKSGFSATQTSVSRDLEELGIEKVDGVYTITPKNRAAREFDPLTLMTAGDNLIIAKCSPGLASAFAVRVDQGNYADIIGTIAGDDTVFIAVSDKKRQASVLKKLREVFNV